MKRILFVLLATVVLTMALVASALAVKPAANLAGNVKVPWNLSADVMPDPPYGSIDIPGSDTASKLNVNQPNGSTEVTITGAMNGLVADTTYSVYLSKGYIVDTTWPGLFTSTVPTFTFTTDEFGAGSWHINMRDSDFVAPGSYDLSVWINAAGGTLLISDTFVVVVE